MPHREVFMDFDPVLVSKLSEKKIIAPGNPSSSLLSEQKLRGVIENARQILKVCPCTIITHVFEVLKIQ
jgi:DNA-3-methyladenine glycosylase I